MLIHLFRVGRVQIILLIIILSATLGPLIYINYKELYASRRVYVLHAGSLTKVFRDVASEFMKKHPNVVIVLQGYGSLEAARRLQAGAPCDVIAVSDYKVIVEQLMNLMVPGTKTPYATWYVSFAGNEMGIATVKGNPKNITSILDLLKPNIRYGRADPNLDPCGYRTLKVFHLAERYYGRVGLAEELMRRTAHIALKEFDLMNLVASGGLDAAFTYVSLALQFNLTLVKLPPEVSMRREITEDSPYAVTVPTTSRNMKLALEFVKFLLSPEGMEIVERNHQPPIIPPRIYGSIPRELKEHIERAWRP